MLSRQQLSDFERNGIVRVSSVILTGDIEAISKQVWDNLERRYPFRRNRPEIWTAQRINGLHALDKSVTFDMIGSPAICQMLDDVLGSGNWQRPARWGSLLMAFPESREEWNVPHGSWHLDLPVSDSVERLFTVRLFTCLHPPHHGGGATLAVAGSHLLVEDLLRKSANQRLHWSDVRKALVRDYAWMKALCSPTDTVDRISRFMDISARANGVELGVIEITGEPGDIFLVDPLILHAPSVNCADIPRMVLSTFAYRNGVEPGGLYQNLR